VTDPRSGPAIPWLALGEVLEAVGGALRGGPPPGPEPSFTGCTIDSRAALPGEIFVPLPGSRADGHAFIGAALSGSAAASFVARGRDAGADAARAGKPLIEVADPLEALQALGRHCRERSGIETVAVTGSNGKTTTKEMIAAVLGTARRVHRNVGNLNNHIGVPLTLTKLTPAHDALVMELGMSARGEIRFLASLCRPEVGVLTNASAAHLLQLGSVEEVALAKSELAEAIPADGLLVLNADDPLLWPMNRSRPVPVRSYALENPEADLRPVSLRVGTSGGTRFDLADGTQVALSLLGAHNARNALAAILVGDRFHVPRSEAARALAALRPARRRLELRATERGVSVLDDAYNANPASMREALALLGSMEVRGARRAVLGDMLELGPEAERLHEETGRRIPAEAWLYAAGTFAGAYERGARSAGIPGSRIRLFEDVEAMARAVARDAAAGDLVLVKGSRGMRLERVVDALAPEPAPERGAPERAGSR
jgi:UDP-N-acetylmuramoyl-tripeptide--D-alanyl-D-alanine ligase